MPSDDLQEVVTLSEFLNSQYSTAVGLTAKSARAFGIPLPLKSGWMKKYANNTARVSDLSVGRSRTESKNFELFCQETKNHLRSIIGEGA